MSVRKTFYHTHANSANGWQMQSIFIPIPEDVMNFRTLVTAGLLVIVASLLSCSSHSDSSAAKPDNQNQLRLLLDEEWEYELKQSPETATALGDNRYNDRL